MPKQMQMVLLLYRYYTVQSLHDDKLKNQEV